MAGDAEAQVALQAAFGFAADGRITDAGADRAEVLPALVGLEEALFRTRKAGEALDPADGLTGCLGRDQFFTDIAVAAEETVDLACRLPSGGQGLDDRLGAVDGVAAGKTPSTDVIRLPSFTAMAFALPRSRPASSGRSVC